METQETSAQVSLMSRMNAFYGIQNVSQETTAAVARGAQAPDVYAPEEVEAPNPQPGERTDENPAPNPVEDYFAETTEQVEISSQAVALQQGQSENGAQQQVATAENASAPEAQEGVTAEVAALANEGEPVPSIAEEQVEPREATPQTAETNQPLNNHEPAAVSALNVEPATAPETNLLDAQSQANPPQTGGYAQFDSGFGGDLQPAAGGNSNATQPGALFSAIG